MNIQQKRALMDMQTILQLVIDEGAQALLNDQSLDYFSGLLTEVEEGARRLKAELTSDRRAWGELTDSLRDPSEREGRDERTHRPR